MNVELGILGKLTRLLMFLLLAALLVVVAVWYLPLIERNERMRRQKLRLEKQIDQELVLERQLKTSIESIQRDPRTVERLARERLGYAKPGETVIRFEPAPPPAATTAPAR
jgi:cell division protein FtsB